MPYCSYAAQVSYAIKRVENVVPHMSELALGGTAVGTGLNTKEGYDEEKSLVYSLITEFSVAKYPH